MRTVPALAKDSPSKHLGFLSLGITFLGKLAGHMTYCLNFSPVVAHGICTPYVLAINTEGSSFSVSLPTLVILKIVKWPLIVILDVCGICNFVINNDVELFFHV